MRVAYFVQSHGRAAQVVRLLAALRRGDPDAALVVGHCPTAELLPRRDLERLGALSFRHRRKVERGSWSLLEPYFDAVELLRREGVGYDWLVYLSGQDYPVRPLATCAAELAASDYDGYLTWQAAEAASPDGRRHRGRLRYHYQYRELPGRERLLRELQPLNHLQRIFHVHLTYGPRLGLRARGSPFRSGFKAYFGSQWTTLRRACAERVAEAGSTGKLAAWFQRTICPDEAFAQTVLINDGRFRFCNDNLRFVDFGDSRDGRPRILRLSDAPALFAGGYHFARKFDLAVDREVLDRIDRELLGVEPEPG